MFYHTYLSVASGYISFVGLINSVTGIAHPIYSSENILENVKLSLGPGEKGLVSLRAQHQPQGTTELSLGNSQWTLEQSIDSFSKRRYKTRAKPTVHKSLL